MYWQYFYFKPRSKRKTKLFWRQFPLYIIQWSLSHKQASPLEHDLGPMPFKFLLYCYKYHKGQKAAHMTRCKNPRLFARNAEKNQIILGETRLAKHMRSVHIQYFPQARRTYRTLARTRPRPPSWPPKLHGSYTLQTSLFLLLNNHFCGGASESISPFLNLLPQSR